MDITTASGSLHRMVRLLCFHCAREARSELYDIQSFMLSSFRVALRRPIRPLIRCTTVAGGRRRRRASSINQSTRQDFGSSVSLCSSEARSSPAVRRASNVSRKAFRPPPSSRSRTSAKRKDPSTIAQENSTYIGLRSCVTGRSAHERSSVDAAQPAVSTTKTVNIAMVDVRIMSLTRTR